MSLQTRDLIPEDDALQLSDGNQGEKCVKASPGDLPEQLSFAFEPCASEPSIPRKPPANVVDLDFNPWNPNHLKLLCSSLSAYKVGSGWRRIDGLLEGRNFARRYRFQ